MADRRLGIATGDRQLGCKYMRDTTFGLALPERVDGCAALIGEPGDGS
tara:strand:+ start:1410 stop:1553 length:144 start_codon:yes stop_codon:yes gene_type:complete